MKIKGFGPTSMFFLSKNHSVPTNEVSNFAFRFPNFPKALEITVLKIIHFFLSRFPLLGIERSCALAEKIEHRVIFLSSEKKEEKKYSGLTEKEIKQLDLLVSFCLVCIICEISYLKYRNWQILQNMKPRINITNVIGKCIRKLGMPDNIKEAIDVLKCYQPNFSLPNTSHEWLEAGESIRYLGIKFFPSSVGLVIWRVNDLFTDVVMAIPSACIAFQGAPEGLSEVGNIIRCYAPSTGELGSKEMKKLLKSMLVEFHPDNNGDETVFAIIASANEVFKSANF